MIVFPSPFHIVMTLVKLWFIRFKGQFPIRRAISGLDLYQLIRPPKMLLVYGLYYNYNKFIFFLRNHGYNQLVSIL